MRSYMSEPEAHMPRVVLQVLVATLAAACAGVSADDDARVGENSAELTSNVPVINFGCRRLGGWDLTTIGGT
jgi:hypothetical protein